MAITSRTVAQLPQRKSKPTIHCSEGHIRGKISADQLSIRSAEKLMDGFTLNNFPFRFLNVPLDSVFISLRPMTIVSPTLVFLAPTPYQFRQRTVRFAYLSNARHGHTDRKTHYPLTGRNEVLLHKFTQVIHSRQRHSTTCVFRSRSVQTPIR
jgi:hypothetical protein